MFAVVAIHQFNQDCAKQLPLHFAALHLVGHEQIELKFEAVAQLAEVELRDRRIREVGLESNPD